MEVIRWDISESIFFEGLADLNGQEEESYSLDFSLSYYLCPAQLETLFVGGFHWAPWTMSLRNDRIKNYMNKFQILLRSINRKVNWANVYYELESEWLLQHKCMGLMWTSMVKLNLRWRTASYNELASKFRIEHHMCIRFINWSPFLFEAVKQKLLPLRLEAISRIEKFRVLLAGVLRPPLLIARF